MAGTHTYVRWSLINDSDDYLDSEGPYPLMVGCRWMTADGRVLLECPRNRVDHPVFPKAHRPGYSDFVVPDEPGEDLLQVGVVQEHVRWLEETRDPGRLTRRVRVTEAPPHNDQ